ncbi:MAG: methyltransferase domain-containing protein [Clostridiales bacterium]|nr:methyltransferase domain-containing protein [Clostridiales bacterium]
MLIEVLGPSGVGKTTLLQTTQSIWDDKIVFPNKINTLLKEIHPNDDTTKMTRQLINNKNLISDKYVQTVFKLISKSNMETSQKLGAINIANSSCKKYVQAKELLKNHEYLIHDELLLHRANSFLHNVPSGKKTAKIYFQTVPIPDAAIFVLASVEVIFNRVKKRNIDTNCYHNLGDSELKEAIEKLLMINRLGAKILSKRGVKVKVIDTSELDISNSCKLLNDAIYEFYISEADIKKRSLRACIDFRRKDGRYVPKTPDVMYCAFTTKNFTVGKDEAQRDAAKRFKKFELNEKTLKGKTILDLGTNIGAMLFEATNYNIAKGMGIEFDYEKIKVAQEIAEISEIDNLCFQQGDIDNLKAENLADDIFDITFAFSIVGHVMKPKNLYSILNEVTKETLYFEANGSEDIENVIKELYAAGFKKVEYLGLCDDDIMPNNNKRPLFRAYK